MYYSKGGGVAFYVAKIDIDVKVISNKTRVQSKMQRCTLLLSSSLNLLSSHLPSFLIVFSLPFLPSSHLGAQHYLDTLFDRCSMSPSGLRVSRCFDINMSVFQRKITKLWVQKKKDTTYKNYAASVQQIVMFS